MEIVKMSATIIVILIILLPISHLIGYKLGYKKSKSELNEKLNSGTGRMGIIRVSKAGAYAFLEVEEVYVAGQRTKVIIHNVSIDRESSESSPDKVLQNWGGNDWVPTGDIIWYENNSQTIRDSKLNSILN
jgi:hypothetical protein